LERRHRQFVTVFYLLFAAAGIWFLGLLIYFYFLYVQCSGKACWELLMGPAIASLYGTPCWALASLCASVKGYDVNKYIRWSTYLIFAIMGVNLLYFLVYG
jgi:hypothetical protein|tara:strand:- start:510 stop:812 length:303 start_codon:yes stop_codon:yes gene_type:complete